MVCDQTVLGMYYLDCANTNVARIDFEIKDHAGNIVNVHKNHIALCCIFVKVVEEWAPISDTRCFSF